MATAVPDGTTGYEAALDVLNSLNTRAEAVRLGDQKARDAMIADCFSLIAKLETPSETFIRTMWTHVSMRSIPRNESDRCVFIVDASCNLENCQRYEALRGAGDG